MNRLWRVTKTQFDLLGNHLSCVSQLIKARPNAIGDATREDLGNPTDARCSR